MLDTAESIRQYGVLVPAIARPRPDGGYELISGHRRHRASQLIGLTTLPVIIRELDDDAATIIMVDSNLQRENTLPSERAFSFKMKLEAIKRQGARNDLTLGQVVPKLPAREQVAQEAGESGKQISRFIRLTYLIPDLLELVDNQKIAFTPAVELSYLKPEEQTELCYAMEDAQATPSLSQAIRLKKFSAEGKLSDAVIAAIISEEKKPTHDKVILTPDKLDKYFPSSFTPERREETILQLLETWHKKRARGQDR